MPLFSGKHDDLLGGDQSLGRCAVEVSRDDTERPLISISCLRRLDRALSHLKACIIWATGLPRVESVDVVTRGPSDTDFISLAPRVISPGRQGVPANDTALKGA